jgi:hypothetical protein
VLHRYAGVSSADYPVIALSCEYHSQISEPQMKCQLRAQLNYLEFAKSKGFHVRHERIRLQTDAVLATGGQAQVWLCLFAPYVDKSDTVLFGYVRNDEFWHYRDKFEKAFKAQLEFGEIQAEIQYPLEWETKASVLRELRDKNVPRNCIWTCENPVEDEPCGKCNKCREFNEAMEKLKAEPESTKLIERPKGWKPKKPKKVKPKDSWWNARWHGKPSECKSTIV